MPVNQQKQRSCAHGQEQELLASGVGELALGDLQQHRAQPGQPVEVVVGELPVGLVLDPEPLALLTWQLA